MPLTNIAIRTAKPHPGRTLKFADGGGLQLWIKPTGAKLWNLAYCFGGKQRKLAIGPFPRLASRKPATAVREFWLGGLAGHQIYVEETSWYSEGGEENSAGGFYRWSKRYKELMLEGPYKAEKLLIKVEARRAFATKEYSWPAGRVAHLTPG